MRTMGDRMMWLLLTSLAWGDAVCNDGSYSYSSGSGTCSWHGGVAYWVAPTPPQPTAEELMLVQLYGSLSTIHDLYASGNLSGAELRQKSYDINIHRCPLEQKMWAWPGGHTTASILQELAKTKSVTRNLHSESTVSIIRGSVESKVSLPQWSKANELAYRAREYSPEEIIDYEGIHVGNGVIIQTDTDGLINVYWSPELRELLAPSERYVASVHYYDNQWVTHVTTSDHKSHLLSAKYTHSIDEILAPCHQIRSAL